MTVTKKPSGKKTTRSSTTRAAASGSKRRVGGKRPAAKRAKTGRIAEAAKPAPRKTDDESRKLAMEAIAAAVDKKAVMPVLLDVSALASYTDFIGIVSGRSDRQVDAIAEGICDRMRQSGRSLVGREGESNGRWTLLDFGDVVVHVFYHPVREFYDLEGLWIDAPRVPLSLPPEAAGNESNTFYGSL